MFKNIQNAHKNTVWRQKAWSQNKHLAHYQFDQN